MSIDGTDSTAGCTACRAGENCTRVGGDLHLVVFDRYEPDAPDQQPTYQNDFLVQCRECATFWLEQYWEYDTPELQFEEFGVRNRAWIALTAQDLAEIDSARASGRLLPQNHFRPDRAL